MYAFNISPSSDNCSSPYYIVYGKEPIDTELRELKELHRYKLWIEIPAAVKQNLEKSCRRIEMN